MRDVFPNRANPVQCAFPAPLIMIPQRAFSPSRLIDGSRCPGGRTTTTDGPRRRCPLLPARPKPFVVASSRSPHKGGKKRKRKRLEQSRGWPKMGEGCFPFPESFFSGHCKMRTNDPTIDGLIEREDPSYSILSVPSLSPSSETHFMPVCLRGMHSFMRTHLPLLFFFKFRRRDMSTVFLSLSSSLSPYCATCLFSFFVFPAIFFISSFSFLRRTSPSKDAHFALGLKRTEKERARERTDER